MDATEVSCSSNHARFKFYLLDGATEIPTFTTPIDPCADAGAQQILVPAIGGVGAISARTGTYAGNRALLFEGSELGIRMRNGQGSANGNDAAFDNVQLLDVTPQLDKSFSPASLDAGQLATLTFTITDTSELAAKQGWSFADTLPAGLVVIDPAASTTCSGGLVDAPAGGGTIAVSGNLDAGQASCTVTVNVSAAAPGPTSRAAPISRSRRRLHGPSCPSAADRSRTRWWSETTVPAMPQGSPIPRS